MKIDFVRAIAGGVLGTVAMTVVGVYVAPLMGLAPMNPANMLAGQMGGNMMLGWGGDFMIGMPLFSGDAVVPMGSLIGHMVFGAVLGAVYGEAGEAVRAAA